MIYETGKTIFTPSQSSATVALSGDYLSKPTVTATACEGDNNDINIAIENITKTQFTIILSDAPGASLTVRYIALGE